MCCVNPDAEPVTTTAPSLSSSVWAMLICVRYGNVVGMQLPSTQRAKPAATQSTDRWVPSTQSCAVLPVQVAAGVPTHVAILQPGSDPCTQVASSVHHRPPLQSRLSPPV